MRSKKASTSKYLLSCVSICTKIQFNGKTRKYHKFIFTFSWEE